MPLKEFDARLEQAVAAVEDSEGTTQLVRTPSAQRDIDQTLDYESAARAQRLRAQVRLLDAEIAELQREQQALERENEALRAQVEAAQAQVEARVEAAERRRGVPVLALGALFFWTAGPPNSVDLGHVGAAFIEFSSGSYIPFAFY